MNEIPPFDEEEKDFITSIENDEWIESSESKLLIAEAKSFANSTLKKDKRMNIRIAERDLHNLKVKAMQEGLPYQTLVSMVLHKYVTGQLIEKKRKVS